MGGRGITGTRVVLILVLLGALYMAGKVVTPAPPGPPVVQKAAPAVGSDKQDATKAAAEMKKHMMEERDMRMKMAREAKMHPVQKLSPEEDPNSMDIRSNFFYDTHSGQNAYKEVDERVAKGQAILDAQKEARQKEKSASPAPAASPSAPPTK
jgi:hypothetical protein